MSSAIRVLLLGALLDGPLHGYEVRRRLELWGADGCANVAYGSIYHGLAKMADEGLLEVVEETTNGGARPRRRGRGGRTVYAITETGRTEFHRQVLWYWRNIMPINDPFQVALTFMDRLDREELLLAMRARADLLRLSLRTMGHAWEHKRAGGVAPHIAENVKLAADQLKVQLTWIEEALPKVERGELP